MKLAHEMLDQFLLTLWHVFPWLAGMGLVFAMLSRLSPCNEGRDWWQKKGLGTDLAYWIFAPVFMRYMRIWVTVLFTIWLFHINDGLKIADFYARGHGPLARLADLTATNCVFLDGRNSFDPAAVRAAGFVYKGIGR